MSTVTFNNFAESCEAHIVLVVDESTSIDNTEAEQIRTGLRNFINAQANTDNRITLIGMSNSDTDLRNDHLIDSPITSSTISSYLNWVNEYRQRTGSGISHGSDFWASGLQAAQSLASTPDIIVIITDGLQVQTPSVLRNRIANLNSNSHIFVYGINPGGNYHTGSSSGGSLPVSLTYYLNRTPIASTSNSDILNSDYRSVANFNELQTALSALSQTLVDSNIGCGALELTDENITIDTIMLHCSNTNLAVGTVTIKSNKGVSYVIEAGTVVAIVNGLTFSVASNTTLLPGGQETIVPVRVNGTPFQTGFYTQVINIEGVDNPSGLFIDFCVKDISTIHYFYYN